MTAIAAYAAKSAGGKFEKVNIKLPELAEQYIEIEVESCGICHSDLSMRDNEWDLTQYPFVGGHEVIGKVSAVGQHVTTHEVWDARPQYGGLRDWLQIASWNRFRFIIRFSAKSVRLTECR